MSKRVTLTDAEIAYILKAIKGDLLIAELATNSRDVAAIGVLLPLKEKLGGNDE